MAVNKVCSSATIEGLTKLINQYYFSSTCYIDDLKVYNKNGLIANGQVKQIKGKFTYYTL